MGETEMQMRFLLDFPPRCRHPGNSIHSTKASFLWHWIKALVVPPVSVAGIWGTRIFLHQRNHYLLSHVCQQGERRVHDEVDEACGSKFSRRTIVDLFTSVKYWQMEDMSWERIGLLLCHFLKINKHIAEIEQQDASLSEQQDWIQE